MAIIQVKFDSTLKQSDIIVPLTNSSRDEAEEVYTQNRPAVQQTAVYGIQSPLIMINNIVIDFSDVLLFELSCVYDTPSVKLVVRDRYKLISTIDTPSVDNELRIQILPKFEDKYKKINLTFYITRSSVSGNIIDIRGEYKLSKFTSDNIKSFGEISTYQLIEKIAQETGLGLASNVADSNDKRYIYCNNKSYNDLLQSEIEMSGSDMQVYDYWIDWWNNIVFADIYERYNATDSDDDMQIWVSGQQKEMEEGSEIQPQKVVASFNNHIANATTELYIKDHSIINNSGEQMYSGTDRVYSIFNSETGEYSDYLIQDGDTQKDIYTKYEYLGEVYGEHDYLLSKVKRNAFLQKIRSNETIEIILRTPLLGVMRGNRCNLLWYINDDMVDNMKETMSEAGVIQEDLDTNIPLTVGDNVEDNNGSGSFTLDKTKSGQYLITACVIGFEEGEWSYKVTLCRPTSAKPVIINEE